jgi:DNA-binding response OmpR family regulator
MDPPCKGVLIVEDDEDIRDTIKLALEMAGYRAYTAANGREGIDALAFIPRPCVILVDLMMPVLDGWGFAKEVRADERLAGIPLVVLTALGGAAETIKADRVLMKPLNLDGLYDTVREFCGPPCASEPSSG